jgi:acetyltransferase
MIAGSLNQTDPSQNFIERYPHPLDPLFHPHTVAVIGAKDDSGSVARTIMVNLLSGSFQGQIYPINPKRNQVLGLKAYSSVASVPEKIDLAIIVTPAPTVPKIVAECVEAHVKSAIIISAGFKELGESGHQLEEEILRYARHGKMPIIGPNCLGVMNPIYGLNATFAKGMALPGNLAFISQSGAMCTAVLDWSLEHKVGFSAFVSIGSMADVNWGTLIDYLGSDPHTHSLLLYMETVGDARSFMTAAREVALEKPIIIIKAGRSQAAAKAAASHTGSLAGSDEVFDAALERIGVLRVTTIAELFNMASVLAKQPRPKGPRLTIITNAGGPGVLATDAAIFNHAELASLPPQTLAALDHVLPSAWSHSNPVDLLGDADAERYAKAVDILMQDPLSDGLLVILSPQDMTDATATAVTIKQLAQNTQKPLLTSWMGGASVREGAEILSYAQLPVFAYPDDAAKTFATMWRYSKNLQTLYEVPALSQSIVEEEKSLIAAGEPRHVKQLLQEVQKEGRTLLTEFESKQVLEDYGIPIVQTLVAHTPEEAASIAKQLGFPVVLKLFSQTITHKTDVGGVKLNLQSAEEVKQAFHDIQNSVTEKVGKEHFEGVTVQHMIKHTGYELILGSTTDPQFGPVVLFGMGGQLVEVFKDRALAIPPLNSNLARQLMQKTKIYEALLGIRGRKPINLSKLEEILIQFSLLIVENRRIKECDVNPLIASEDKIIALDARIVLHDFKISDDQLPRLAIRPYPFNYVRSVRLKNGVPLTLRPIYPEDEHLIVQFHRELSEHSVRQRYFEFMNLDQRVAHERLIRICFNDYDREWAIVAELDQNQQKKIIGIGRLIRIPGIPHAQFKLIIVDAYHHLGLGTQLLKHLLLIAKQEKIEVVDGYILFENKGMLKICEKLGFSLHQEKGSSIIHAEWKAIDLFRNC